MFTAVKGVPLLVLAITMPKCLVLLAAFLLQDFVAAEKTIGERTHAHIAA